MESLPSFPANGVLRWLVITATLGIALMVAALVHAGLRDGRLSAWRAAAPLAALVLLLIIGHRIAFVHAPGAILVVALCVWNAWRLRGFARAASGGAALALGTSVVAAYVLFG